MRDQYVGDLGDFGKYALLRFLTGQDLKLGVVWYYRPNVPGQDSDHHNYAGYRRADPQLYDLLQALIHNHGRFVRCVEEFDVLPGNTRYFRDLLDYAGIPPGAQRQQFRERWLHDALQATNDVDVVYLDPDVGLIPYAVDVHSPKGCNYAHPNDIGLFLEHGKSVVLYQTIRGRSVGQRIDAARALLPMQSTQPNKQIRLIALQFNTRLFIILPQQEHRERIKARVRQLLASSWGAHFRRVPSNGAHGGVQ